MADQTPIPAEPQDGARIEFTHNTDVYGAWRDDASSVAAGWPSDAGWCVYGESVPLTWAEMVEHFGDSLRGLTVLVPVAAGLAAGQTPTANLADASRGLAADRTPIPAEPPTGTMLLALDPTPGYEGIVVGVWHRRDDGAWVDGEHRWFSSYCRRMPNEPYTWAEAVARGAQPDRPLIEVAAGLAAGRTAAAADIRATFEARHHPMSVDRLIAERAARVAENGGNR